MGQRFPVGSQFSGVESFPSLYESVSESQSTSPDATPFVGLDVPVFKDGVVGVTLKISAEAAADGGAWDLFCGFRMVGGTIAELTTPGALANPSAPTKSTAGAAAWGVGVTGVNAALGQPAKVRITLTGQAATSIKWRTHAALSQSAAD